MADDQNGVFKDKITEWRGYTLRALEDISKELTETKEGVKACNIKIDVVNTEINKKLDKLDDRLTGLYIKVAAIGGTMGLIVSLIGILVSHGLG
jgi:hypothetical protein